ncbi:MAG: ribonuclease HII [Bacteroidia bacterium]|nr:MAG: ribonuclease HII [Bacteroidia bacterium]
MHPPLKTYFSKYFPEAGCDEAGRGCLAGPVVAAAVILPRKPNKLLVTGLNDSKILSAAKRMQLREIILQYAISYGIALVDNTVIDEINILQASILAMHRALKQLSPQPAMIVVDGNRFNSYENIPHHCVVKGDATYLSVAAASILAKTSRDALMGELDIDYPYYGWKKNKGYPTMEHRQAIGNHGLSPYHRRSFRYHVQWKIDFDRNRGK